MMRMIQSRQTAAVTAIAMGIVFTTSSAFAADAAAGATAAVGIGLIVVGGLIGAIAGIWFLVRAFGVGIGWGISCLLLPGAALVFLFAHWREAAKPFLMNVLGIAFCVVGFGYAGVTLDSISNSEAFQRARSASRTRMPSMPAAKAKKADQETAKRRQAIEQALSEVRIGDDLEDTIFRLGRPTARLSMGNQVGIQYPDFRIISDDGQTVTDIIYEDDDWQIQRVTRDGKPVSTPGRKTDKGSGGQGAADTIVTIANGGKAVNIPDLLVEGQVTVIDFYADWCAPCRKMSPLLEKVATEDNGVFLRKVDIVNWETAVVKQHAIRSVPNVWVFNGQGKQIGQPSSDINQITQNIAAAR